MFKSRCKTSETHSMHEGDGEILKKTYLETYETRGGKIKL
jgi:hypothetical protein